MVNGGPLVDHTSSRVSPNDELSLLQQPQPMPLAQTSVYARKVCRLSCPSFKRAFSLEAASGRADRLRRSYLYGMQGSKLALSC